MVSVLTISNFTSLSICNEITQARDNLVKVKSAILLVKVI